jgi:hypothetical protein
MLNVNGLLCALAASLTLAGAVSAQNTPNFQFTVEAEAGLRLAVAGYNAAGERTFLEKSSKQETYEGERVYIVRVDEQIIFSGQVAMWCVQDLKKKWALPAKYGKKPGDVLCDRAPRDSGKGTFKFVVR